ncbi:ferritin-like domain-containing protein [Kitasatospora sp. NBC_01266]|uniref:ferritin-like domain-containing protein n=1 Tax=Kitasatospora sp. NBC_01266 TaxID=2903572 RepID=UPI002E30BA46|nr:ferritin-like domain-containing protein [Kitasatospora sp. NBC_01266]
MQSPSRRTFLAAGAMAAAGLLAACTSSGAKSDAGSGSGGGAARKADPDLPLRTRAVAATDALIAQYATAQGGGAPNAQLDALRADLRTQRAALATGLPAGAASPRTSAAASAGATASASPSANSAAGAAASPATLAAAEWSTAQARLADLAAASPELAKLLASVSAAGALHTLELGNQAPLAATQADAPSATPSPAASGTLSGGLPAEAVSALQAALAGEHAAVYAFGVIGALIPVGPKRDDARACYAAHQARRDTWQRLLAGAGATPLAAAPGYQLPFAVPDAATAAKLAATVETRLTALYADLVAAAAGSLRLAGATALRACTLQAYHWGGAPGALPGMPAPAAASAPASP